MTAISEMDYEKVKSGLQDKSIVLIDVRTAEERKEKHGAIPGSKHIWSKFLMMKTCQSAFNVNFGIMIKSKVIKMSLWNFFTVDELPDAFKLDSGAFEAKFGFAKPAEDATIVTH